MEPSEIFKKHISKFTTLSDADFEEVFGFFTIHDVAKKETLTEEGQLCRYHYFVLEGMLRLFFINEKGTEQTTEFALETWWLTDNIAYEHQLAGSFSIQAVERSRILRISRENQEQLLLQFPQLERYFRFVYQRAYAAAQMRVKYLFSRSKEDFYRDLVRKYPDFVQRVPQYLIASFLGFTPEYLSEIRKKDLS